ncbi:SusC/RagA family TonB-linked outer membrane protein [Sunxiuqinia indica]|uniref:SusC/RagA family TonB-linked outer membrane protein n=1 Tax=Sunxiuqinia indica TaxID=2692584 RepID=UPI001356C38D|nr:SusC/RagA family TonB-linked outer membrane protein [Sunxiuqinia indica]
MRLTLLAILLSVFQGFALNSYSQNTRLTLKMENATIKQVLNSIEEQTDFFFLYNSKLIDVEQKVSIDVPGQNINNVLDQLFAGTDIQYEILDRQIILSNRNQINAQAGSTNVKGRVTDDSSEPLPGVTVVVKGTTYGTITDIDGYYQLNNLPPNAILVFSFVGMRTIELPADRSVINVKLDAETIGLDEVVAIGYGTMKKADVTSSVASVKQDDFVKATVKNAGQLLQGKVAGLTIASSSGDPTSGVAVLLRGNTTILGANTTPLILIDGIPGDLNTVAPEDIESIDVLKDGSAAAIYGVRGNNGVILIQTKRFKAGEISSIEYSTQLSTQRIARKLDMLTAEDYIQQIADGTRGASWDNGYSTDWFKEATQKPFSQVHNLTFKGGNVKTNYLFNFNYKSSNGIIKKSDNDLFNGRVDIVHNMFDGKLKLNFGIIGRQNTYTTTGDGYSFDGWIYRQMMTQNPTSPIKDDNGNWFQEGIFDYDNPLARLYESDGRNKSQYTRYTTQVNYNPINGLNLSANVAYDKYNQSRGYSETKKHITTIRDGRNGYASIGNDENIYRFLELIAEYKKNIKNHNFSILGGYGYQENEWLNSSMNNYDFATDVFGYANIGAGKALAEGRAQMSSSRGTTNLISFFSRGTYSYKDKYLLMVSVRHEAASQLYGTKKPWGTFPAVSIGWRINEESFMKSASFMDILKLRAGYGVTGNPPMDSFLGVATLNYADYYLINGNWIRSLVPSQNPNPNLRWEEKKEYNIGLDYGFFGNRLYGSIDLYNRRIDGLLYDYQVPSPPNIYTSTRVNVGVMENKGVELDMSYVPVKKPDLNWTVQVLFSTNSNKLVSLSNDLYKLDTNYFTAGSTDIPIQTFTHIVEIGKEIGNFYGYKVVDITEDGKWMYENKEGEIVDYDNFNRGFDDKKVIGNGIPKFYASLNNTIKYKNFDLGITMRGAFDFQIINFQRMYYENTGEERYNRLKSAYNKIYGKAVLNKNMPLEFNSYYVEDGDFWKIDNITLGYNLKSINSKFIHSARVYLSSLNTFTITGYKGIDPEVNWTGLDPGIDNRDKYPTTRTITLGLNVNF